MKMKGAAQGKSESGLFLTRLVSRFLQNDRVKKAGA